MTKDDIIRMAADVAPYPYDEGMIHFDHEELIAFYNRAVAHEQNRCIGIIHGQCGSDNVAQRTVDAIRSQS